METFEALLSDAIDTVSAWDLPETEFAEAVNAQAKLMAGVPADDYWQPDLAATAQ